MPLHNTGRLQKTGEIWQNAENQLIGWAEAMYQAGFFDLGDSLKK